MKRFFCIFSVFFLSHCVNSGGGGGVSGGPSDVQSVVYIGVESINTKACVEFQIRLLNENEQTITASQDITINLTTTGQTKIYENETCETLNQTITVAQGDFRGIAYMRGETVESIDVKYQSVKIATVSVSKFSQDFATKLDGAVNDIEKLNSEPGGIYIGGAFSSVGGDGPARITKLKVDGNVDQSFALSEGTSTDVNKILLADSNSDDIFIGGDWIYINQVAKRRFAKISSTGTLDETYTPNNGFTASVYDLSLDTSGSIYVGGSLFDWENSTTTNGLARFTGPAELDVFYEGTGFGGAIKDVRTMHIDENNDIYAGGKFTLYNGVTYNKIIRLNQDGSVDADFNIGTGFNNDVFKIVPASDGKIYVGGKFTTYKGVGSNRLIRINADGSLDASFDVGTGFNSDVNAIAVLEDGSLFVGGDFTTYKGSSANRLIKLLENGSVDSGFDIGTGFNSDVHEIEIPNDYSGDLWVGGAFTTFDGQAQRYLIRLDEVGNLD